MRNQIVVKVRGFTSGTNGRGRHTYVVGRLVANNLRHASKLIEAIENVTSDDNGEEVTHRAIPFVRVYLPGSGLVDIVPDELISARDAINAAIHDL